MSRARAPRQRRKARALPRDFEATLASLQASVMAPAVTAPSPRWQRVHHALEDLSRRNAGQQRVRSPFLIPLA